MLVSATTALDADGGPSCVAVALKDISEHRKAEEQLAEERNLLRTLMDNLPDYAFVKDAKSRFVTTNAAHLRLLGMKSQEEVEGKTDAELFSPELAREYRADEKRVLTSGKPLLNKVEVARDAEGRELWLLTSKVPLTGADGKVSGLVGISRDITACKQSEDLIKAQRDLASSLNAITDLHVALQVCLDAASSIAEMDCGGVYLISEDTGAMDLVLHSGLPSAFVKAALRYDANSPNAKLVMKGIPIYSRHQDLGIPLDDARRQEELRAMAVVPFKYENRVIGCLNVASHVLDDVPAFSRVALESVAAQIGGTVARCRTGKRLRDSESKTRSMFEKIPVGLYRSTSTGRIVDVNQAFVQLLGYSDRQSALDSILAEQCVDFEQRQEWSDRLAHEGVLRGLEAQWRQQDGNVIWLRESARVVRDNDGKVLHYEGVVEDVSPQKQVEQDLRDANRCLSKALEDVRRTQQQVLQHARLSAVGQLTSGIAHDFNNALVPIVGFSELLIKNPTMLADKEEALDMLKDIYDAAKHATHVIRRLREFYRPAGNAERKQIDLNELMKGVLSLTQPKWKEDMGAQGVAIAFSNELGDIPSISGNESQLREVLTNIVLNAADAMPKGGTIGRSMASRSQLGCPGDRRRR